MSNSEQAVKDVSRLYSLAQNHGIPLSLGVFILIAAVVGTMWLGNIKSQVTSLKSDVIEVKQSVSAIAMTQARHGRVLYLIQFKLGIPAAGRQGGDYFIPPPRERIAEENK